MSRSKRVSENYANDIQSSTLHFNAEMYLLFVKNT